MSLATLVSHLPRGKHRAAHLLGRQMRPGVFKLDDGIRMFLDPGDPFQSEIAFGVYQSKLTSEIDALMGEHDVVLTAGAHIGYYMLRLGLKAKQVIGFECDPRLVDICQQNISLNQLHTTLIPFGLGALEGSLEMNISKNPGQSSFSIAHYLKSRATVRVRRGDNVLRELGISHVDGLLLDLEGWESHAIEGLSETLARRSPRWAIIECFDVALENAGSSRQALLSQIESIGLHVHDPTADDLICTAA